jgi:hypothetical protein
VKLTTKCPICEHPPIHTLSSQSDLNGYSPEVREIAAAYMALTGEQRKRETLGFCGHCRAVYRQWFFDAGEIERIYNEDYLRLESSVLDSAGYIYNKPTFLDDSAAMMKAIVSAMEDISGCKEKIIFDIGGRDGFRLKQLSEDGYECVVYDPIAGETCAPTIRKVRTWLSSIEADSRADVMFLCNVLEHSIDPYRMIRECSDHLTATGFLYVELPSDIEKVFDWMLFSRWRNKNFEVDFTHFIFFSRRSICLLLESSGFEVLECKFRKVESIGITVMAIVARKSSRKVANDCRPSSLAYDLFASGYLSSLPSRIGRKMLPRPKAT